MTIWTRKSWNQSIQLGNYNEKRNVRQQLVEFFSTIRFHPHNPHFQSIIQLTLQQCILPDLGSFSLNPSLSIRRTIPPNSPVFRYIAKGT